MSNDDDSNRYNRCVNVHENHEVDASGNISGDNDDLYDVIMMMMFGFRVYQSQLPNSMKQAGLGSMRVSTVYRVGSLLLSEGVSTCRFVINRHPKGYLNIVCHYKSMQKCRHLFTPLQQIVFHKLQQE